ncbi:tetratricopeptide repeat protein [soil metagenome]
MPSRDQLLQQARADHSAGKLQAAQAGYQQILSANPDDLAALAGRGAVAMQTRNFSPAVAIFQRALTIDPNSLDTHINLGIAHAQAGQTERAIEIWNRALTIDGRCADVYINLTNAYRKLGRLDDAATAGRRATELDPQHAEARSNLANVLSAQGRVDEAIVEFRRAIELKPAAVRIHSNLLMNLQYSDSVSPQAVFDEHLNWARQHADPLTAAAARHPNNRDLLRRLRVGYVSADFREHPISHFTEPLLAAHDRASVEVFCFADVHRRDAVTARLQALCEHWHEITGQSHERAAQLIREHRIDILVDLAVHTSGHRLQMFARKPAPVQVTYLGYAATSGIGAMDWRLSDVHVDPAGLTERYHREQIYRLPRTQWCYNPRDLGGEVRPSPALRNGFITFGSFNKLNKISPTIFRMWGRILARIDDARLLVKAAGLDDPPTRARFIEQLRSSVRSAGKELDEQRVRLVGWSDLPTYLSLFNEVDVALDSYPFAGGTTSCNSVWMGVPLITLAGDVSISRVGASILHNLELPDRIARTEDEYFERALRDAADLAGVAALRESLRARVRASPLMDAQAFARDVEAAYRQMWRQYCDQGSG